MSTHAFISIYFVHYKATCFYVKLGCAHLDMPVRRQVEMLLVALTHIPLQVTMVKRVDNVP